MSRARVSSGEHLDLADIQGLFARGYGDLPEAAYLLLAVTDAHRAGVTLARWADRVDTALGSSGTGSSAAGQRETAWQVAVTSAGISALAGPDLLAGFSEQFTSGMATTYRSRLLGDVADDDPRHWRWGGPDNPPVHLMVLLFAIDLEQLASIRATAMTEAEGGGLTVVHELMTATLASNEPFGFHDGISQPTVAGLPRAQGAAEVVRAGEFLLGYRNEYGQRSERPLLHRSQDPQSLLPKDADGSGCADLGRGGSYLVLRALAQDVAAFHSYLEGATRRPDGTRDDDAAVALGAKMVGRWPSGAPLVLAPDRDDPTLSERNDFDYHAADPHGLACPLGAHIRRANPRDALEPAPGTAASRAINHRHRVLRRGRGYQVKGTAGTAEVGLYFLCLNANLARQFEFVQHSWLNDPGFNLLDDAADPVMGPRHGGGATFAVQQNPVRRRYRDLPQFVHVRGGAYFFLPGISALRYLSWRAIDRTENS